MNSLMYNAYCTLIILLIPQKKQGVAANILYPYVGPIYLNVVVVIIENWYYFQINMSVCCKSSTLSICIKGKACKL